MPVKHIRVETSATTGNSSIQVYNIKELDDTYITENYTKEEFENLQYIKSSLVGYLGETYVGTTTHRAYYETPYSVATINVNKTVLSTQATEKNVQITVGVKANENANQVKWQNGAFLLKLPNDILDVEINSIRIDNSNVKITSYEQYEEDGVKYIKINTENNEPDTYDIKIDCNITPDPRIASTTENIILYAYNQNAVDYWNKTADIYDVNDNLNTAENVGTESKSISLVSPNSLLTSETLTNYDENGSISVAPKVAEVSKEQKTANVNVEIKNNYSRTISEVTILGRVPFEGNKYVINGENMGSSFTAPMQSEGIVIPEGLKDIATVYYSENGEATKDLVDEANGWKTADEITDFSKVKSYLIDLGNYALAVGENYTFVYTISVPENLNYNQVSYSQHAVYFSLDTKNGKYRTQVEPNKVGLMIAKQYDLEVTKYQKGKEKVVSGATYSITEEGAEESKTKVTGENGTLTLTGLYVDRTYIVREILKSRQQQIIQ